VVTLWIGDFRTKQLQNIYKTAQQTAEYHYLVDDLAEQSWFINNAITQLPAMELEKANVVIMLGFNDCVYSCIWDTFKANLIAEKYAMAINELIKDYPDFNFYICSVNPIDADYPFAEHENGLITKKQLDEKIKLFNTTLKKECKAEYIDSYKYLTDTIFTTRDGVRFTPDTCNALHNYIKANLKYGSSATFLPRISAPDPEVDSFLYWTSTAHDGVNPFTKLDENGEPLPGVLPSSTAYAWGRFYEVIGEAPKLPTSDASSWYNYKADGYKRGDTPKVGAIACWASSKGGYVAVVEQVKSDGSIITSESAWDGEGIWRLFDREKGTDGNWGMASSYTFQGFIYCPQTVGASKEEICTKNAYNISIEEMKPNAQCIYQYLSARGWTLNAIAGLLGNLQVESKMSPAIWESIIEGLNADGTLNKTVINNYYSGHGRYPGFGLVQWTPYSKYTDWCDTHGLAYDDIDSQLQRIDYEAEHKIQWIARPTKGYDLTFEEFMSSTRDASWLAAAFAFCYERPQSTNTDPEGLKAERGANGDFWYSYLSTLSFDTISDARPKISGFKLDECSATHASISFLVNNSATVKYSLLKGNAAIESSTFDIKKGYKVINLKNLMPVTAYTLMLEARNVAGEIVARELSFETLQDFPENVASVELTVPESELKSTKSLFTLKINKPSYLGYWKARSGYDISLIVNNISIKTISVDNASKDFSVTNFSLENKFGYKCITGDSIQIGVSTWVKDDRGNKLYNKQGLRLSKPICLLNKQTIIYLNK
jgi:hypothetical protein